MSVGVLHVSASAVAANWRRIARQVGPAVEVGGVVKANCYGLGLPQVAPALCGAGCKTFFVVTVDEAIEARQVVGPEARVIVMGGVDWTRSGDYLTHRLTPAINTLTQLHRFKKDAKRAMSSDRRFPVWIQIDTGMTRLGFDADERRAFLKDVDSHVGPALRIDAIMSHLASADEINPQQTEEQLHNFIEFDKELKRTVPSAHSGFQRSLANSFATFRDSKYHFDVVRPGMALYGLKGNLFDPSATSSPVLRTVHLSAPIVQVRRAEKGAKVSYNATYTLKRDSVVGVIGIGYADGFHRHNSGEGAAVYWPPAADPAATLTTADEAVNREPVEAGEQVHRLPVIGRVCMDSIMVDLTDVPTAQLPSEGDSVEVLGPHVPPDALAVPSGTNGYEILTSLGKRFKRVYV